MTLREEEAFAEQSTSDTPIAITQQHCESGRGVDPPQALS